MERNACCFFLTSVHVSHQNQQEKHTLRCRARNACLTTKETTQHVARRTKAARRAARAVHPPPLDAFPVSP